MNALSRYDNGPVNSSAGLVLFVVTLFLITVGTAYREPLWRVPMLWTIGIGALLLAVFVVTVLIAFKRGERNSRLLPRS